jgi:hypothetical protein
MTDEIYTLNSIVFDRRFIFVCDYDLKQILMFNYALRKIKVLCAGEYRKKQYPLQNSDRFTYVWNFGTWYEDLFGRSNSMRLLRTKTFKNVEEFRDA